MEDFWTRRKRAAAETERDPGLRWEYKVDGRLIKKPRLRDETVVKLGLAEESRQTIIGDLDLQMTPAW
eukprot:11664293-Karenia_brevis.AAC.1